MSNGVGLDGSSRRSDECSPPPYSDLADELYSCERIIFRSQARSGFTSMCAEAQNSPKIAAMDSPRDTRKFHRIRSCHSRCVYVQTSPPPRSPSHKMNRVKSVGGDHQFPLSTRGLGDVVAGTTPNTEQPGLATWRLAGNVLSPIGQ